MFQFQGIDEHGKATEKQLQREQMATFLINLQCCLIGVGACGSARH